MLGLFWNGLAQAYTGVTIVINAATPTNLEFVDNFRQELINEKQFNLKVKIINLEGIKQRKSSRHSHF